MLIFGKLWAPYRNSGPCRRGGLLSIALLLLVTLSVPSAASCREYPHHPVNLSLFYPISTSRDPEISTNFRLSLIYGDVGSVHGVDINGVVGRIRRDMAGLQASGIYSHIDGEFRGAAASGVANYVKADSRGLQWAGLVNFMRGNFAGFQFASLFNYVEGELTGIQATALFNLNDGDAKYFQYASIANATARDFTGLQLAGGLNYVNESMTGAQAGLFCFAKVLRGVQVGAANVVGTTDGLQVGVVNIANENTGLAFGMINYAHNGSTEWVTYGSSLAAVSTGVRTELRRFYSMLTAGIGDLKDDRRDTGFLSWHYGYAVPVRGNWSIGVDAGYVHIMPTPSEDPSVNDKTHFAVQGRVLLELRLSDKARIFGGGGVSVVYPEYSSSVSGETDPLLVLGVSLY